VRQESERYLEGAGQLLAIARGTPEAPDDSKEHYAALDVLSREIRNYTAAMFQSDRWHDRANLLASLIEEEDWTASLGETLYQIARRVERQPFSATGRGLIDTTLDEVAGAMRAITPNGHTDAPVVADTADRLPKLQELREVCLKADLPWTERGALLTLLGSVERAFYLIERIDAERNSVLRPVLADEAPAKPEVAGDLVPVPT
jgi:phosphate:Na+ symporter